MTIPESAPATAASGAGADAAPACQEQELKLRLRAQDVAVLRARLDGLARARSERVDSTYFDTTDLRLAGARAALRLRALGQGRRRRWVQTFKTGDSAAAFARRGEWETAVDGARIDLGLLRDSPLAMLLGPEPGHDAATPLALAPVFRTCFERSTWDVVCAGSRIEVVIDRGFIEAGGRREPIEEAELELHAGSAAAVWQLAVQLSAGATRRAADISLLPYGASKAARGYRLARGAAVPQATALPPPVLARDSCAAAAARALVAQEITTVLALTAAPASAAEPESVHQARVALRRLRSGLDILAADTPRWLPPALRQWSRRLGVVRDADVLCEQWLPALANAGDAALAAPWARVLAAARRRRAVARARLQMQLQTPAFASFALRALQWSATPVPLPGPGLAAIAPARILRQLRQLADGGGHFARHGAARQHRLRRQAKALRYAIELLAPALPGALRGAPLRALRRFQDAAGRARDAVLLADGVARLSRSAVLRAAAGTWARARHEKAAQRAQRAAAKLAPRGRK